jgi:hypothetical protein
VRSQSAARCGGGSRPGRTRPRGVLAERPLEVHVERTWPPLSANGERESAVAKTPDRFRLDLADLQVLSFLVS